MRCSYSETRLDAYVDGTLAPRERARVEAHLARCTACAELVAELRVVDALLLTPRRLEPAANFTFKVMAEVRPLPVPHVGHSHAIRILVTYIVFAWATIGAFLWWGGSAAVAMLTMLGTAAQRAGTAVGTLSSSVGQIFGSQTFDVTRAMATILAADLALAAAVVGLLALRRRMAPAAARTRGLS